MTKPKVVIVDNSRDACKIYEDTLKASGYDTLSVYNEEKALRTIQSFRPQLILLDILMPKINGIHILDLICKDQKMKNIDVVVLTSVTDSEIRKQALDLGAKDYLIKNEVSMKDLLKKVDKVLSR